MPDVPTLQFSPDAPADVGLRVDLNQLVAGRMMIQGNSGAGKSWLIRYMLEQTYGAIPHLVLDPEGEFYTLREEYGYVWAGAGDEADVPLHPDTAKVMARRFVEVGASVVLDLFELEIPDRRAFIAAFTEELVNLPRKLWKPLLVVLDEAHQYVPQAGSVVSSQPVINLCALGRKRGFTPVLATHRLSKIDKDAAAVLQNKFIGRTDLDTDVRRASDHLGLDKDGRQQLRHLEPGTFFCYGPALDRDGIVLARSGDVQTTHPEPGEITPSPPPPPDEVSNMLGQLEGMAEEAEEEERTIEALRAKVDELRDRCDFLTEQNQDLNEAILDGDVGDQKVQKLRRELREELEEEIRDDLEERIARVSHDAAWGVHDRWDQWADELEEAWAAHRHIIDRLAHLLEDTREERAVPSRPSPPDGDLVDVEAEGRRARDAQPRGGSGLDRSDLREQQREILDAVAAFDALGVDQIDSRVIAAYVGLSPGSSWCRRHFQELDDHAAIRGQWGDHLELLPLGRRLARTNGRPASLAELHRRCLEVLRPKQASMLREIIDRHPEGATSAELAEASGLSPRSSWFSRHIKELREQGFIDVNEDVGCYRATDLLFPEHLD